MSFGFPTDCPVPELAPWAWHAHPCARAQQIPAHPEAGRGLTSVPCVGGYCHPGWGVEAELCSQSRVLGRVWNPGKAMAGGKLLPLDRITPSSCFPGNSRAERRDLELGKWLCWLCMKRGLALLAFQLCVVKWLSTASFTLPVNFHGDLQRQFCAHVLTSVKIKAARAVLGQQMLAKGKALHPCRLFSRVVNRGCQVSFLPLGCWDGASLQ